MKGIVVLFAAIMVLHGSHLEAQQQQGAPAQLPPLSAEAQAALEDLAPRFATIAELHPGWYRERSVSYYDFGAVTTPVVPGRVLWPIHGFDARGNPVAIRGQRPIFSAIPGVDGYSGIFRLVYVVAADRAKPNEINDLASAEAFVRRGRARLQETDLMLNLPIVPRGSSLQGDNSTPTFGWFAGREVQYFDFGAANLLPAPLVRFVRDSVAGESVIIREQHSILDTLPLAPPFSDLWDIRFVRADTTYEPNSLRSAAAIARSNMVAESRSTVRNSPVALVEGNRVEREPSPLRAFSDLRSPYPPSPTITP